MSKIEHSSEALIAEQEVEVHHFQYQLEQRKRVQAHLHSNCEIVFYKSISGTAIIGGLEIAISSHSILYIPPYTNHEFKLNSQNNDFYVVRYAPSNLNTKAIHLGEDPLWVDLPTDTFTFLEQQLQWYLHFSREHQKNIAQAVLTSVSVGIAELCPRLDQDPRRKVFTQLFHMLDEQQRYHISVDEAAQFTNYSRSHFFELFKKLYGQDFSQVLLKRRMQVAEQALRSGQLKVVEIAKRLNYDKPAYFSKVFKEQTGFSPLEYRERARQKQP